MNCIVFTAKSKYAKFRKAYTTTSTFTHLLVPPTAVRGLIGAILGIDRVDLYKETVDLDIAVQVINEVNKDTQSFNLNIMNSEKGKSFSYPSNIEFLRDVEYRIFIKSSNVELLSKIEKALNDENYFYTPYLGGTEHICKLNYEGLQSCEKLVEGEYSVCTAFDKKRAKRINLADTVVYSDNLPTKFDEKRAYIEYKKIYFPVDNNVVSIISDNIYKVGDRYVEFL